MPIYGRGGRGGKRRGEIDGADSHMHTHTQSLIWVGFG